MILKQLLLPTILILSSCGGPKALFVDDCSIAPSDLRCSMANPKPKQNPSYALTPLEANGYLCRSTGDFLVLKLYIINLQNNLAKCIKTPVKQPIVSDCTIDGADAIVYCSDGITVQKLSWADALGYLCTDSANFELLKVYQNTLIQDIAACS